MQFGSLGVMLLAFTNCGPSQTVRREYVGLVYDDTLKVVHDGNSSPATIRDARLERITQKHGGIVPYFPQRCCGAEGWLSGNGLALRYQD
jgi:hypothetical protein